MNKGWMNWIPAACLIAMLAISGGCKCIPCFKKDECECITCPTPPGRVNEEEKGKLMSRLNVFIDSRINRDGCTPEEERFPMLKRIADKSLQQEENPLLKNAAKIKHEEEMCQQKLKAVRYLGQLGCGCYDEDYKVSDAMVAALKDCLPAVRLAAVQAIGGCVCNEPTQGRLCCNPEISARLYEMAWGYDKQGNLIEPVDDIRAWAAQVYGYCPKAANPEEALKEFLKEKEEKQGEGPRKKSKDKDPEKKDDKESETPTEPTPDPTTPPVPPEEESTPDAAPATEAATEPLPVPELEPAQVRVTRNAKSLGNSSRENRMIVNLRSSDAGLRLATIDLVKKCAQDGFAYQDERPDVNGETTLGAMQQLAFGTDKDGNWAEENSQVREAAAEAVAQMNPASVAAQSSPVTTAATEASAPAFARVKAAGSVTDQPSQTTAAPAVLQPEIVEVPPAPAAVVATLAPQVLAQPTVAAPVQTAPSQTLIGVVDSVDVAGEQAMIRLGSSVTPSRQARVLVTHKYVLGRLQTIGEFEITNVAPGMATIRPVAGMSIKKISVGDSATVLGK